MEYYSRFFRQHGVRRPAQLTNPPLSPTDTLRLPRGSVLHYFPEDTVQYGIAGDDWLLRDVERLVMVDHVTQLGDNKGNPRSTHLVADTLVRQYHRSNRKLKPVRSLETQTRDDRTLLVVNYALLPHLYRYTTSVYSGYYRWYNMQAALWQRARELTEAVPDRQQFIREQLPQTLPSLASFRKAERSLSRTSLEPFASAEALFLLEIWKWLGDAREDSLIAQIPTEKLSQINVIIQETNRWFVVNLGGLNSWRADQDSSGLEPAALQKRFLRMVMELYETKTVAVDENEIDGKKSEPEEDDETPASHQATIDPVDVSDAKDDVNDDDLEKDLDALNKVLEEKERGEAPEVEVAVPVPTSELDHTQGVMSRAERLAESGLLSAAEYRRFEALSQAHRKLPNPYTGKGSLVDMAKISKEDLAIDAPTKFADSKTVLDKSMLESTLVDFDRRYTEKVLPKDIANCVLNIQQAGFAVTGYEVEEVEDVANHYEVHTVRVTPVSGSPSTIHFRVPKVQEDGTYLANGVKYRMRKQRGDVPIRKVNPRRVALTSYYGKVFTDRSERAVEDYGKWLVNQIVAIGLDQDDARITELKISQVFDPLLKLPRIYSTLAQRVRSFKAGDIEIFVDYAKRHTRYGQELVEATETNDMTVMGRKGKNLVVVDPQDTLYEVKNGELEVLGKIEELIGVSLSKAPVEAAELLVFSKGIPMGVVLGFYLGLDQLIARLGVTVRRLRSGERLDLDTNEFVIRFEDETLVVNRDDKLASLILAGFNRYKRVIRQYALSDFNRPDVYHNVLEQNGLGVRYLRELNLLQDLFIDPITRDLLVDMGEPTDWIGLLMRSAELLLTDYAPAETDLNFMRIKGYERLAGAVYSQFVDAARGFAAREGGTKNQLDMSPHAIWQHIQDDPSKAIVEESNPIHNLKEKEIVTYGGHGGRSRRSMVKRSRVFHPSDMGTISEATTDSGDVGINTYMTANPKLTTLRGTTARYDQDTDGVTSLLSTSALLSPAADSDDPKRVNFINIQQSSGISAKGYKPTPLRTGYEQVLGFRTDDLFAYSATGKGKVTKVSKEAITVQYEDGSTRSVELGRRFGIAGGTTFPHSVVTPLKVGDSFEEGDVVAYNEDYFTLDTLNPKRAVWKAGLIVKTAICESPDTLEDSSAISERVAEELSTNMTKVRTLVIPFEQTVRRMIAEGTPVESESILCTIEDAVTADNDLFNEETLDTLRVLSANTPRAKYAGTVERIEVFYHGDLEDMSESLRALAVQSDKALAKRCKALGKKVVTGEIDGGMRFESNPLELDTVAIRIYITSPTPAGIGDKGAFGNQLKTVFARVMGGVNETESGTEIDAIFGYQSISDRIVLSPEIMGTTNTLLRVISQRVAKVYRGS